MKLFEPGHKFEFGNRVPAVVDKVIDSDQGIYQCVYRQGQTKLVRDKFTFNGEDWMLPDIPEGTVLKYSEKARFSNLLES